jgi:cytochrome c
MRYKKYTLRLAIGLVALAVLFVSAGCGQLPGTSEQISIPGGDPERGREAFVEYGCHSCHSIPGVARADAFVGPPLENWAERSFIAGQFPNEPDTLIRWIMDPQAMIPGTAMPDMGVSEQAARDMSAYLYTLSQ